MIDEDRKKHIWAVAEILKKIGKEQNMSEDDCNALYTLGLLHDIGYEFTTPENYEKHEIIGGTVLKNLGYKHWKEIYYHNLADSPYQSYFLELLNYADMIIDSEGNLVTMDERLEELSSRYNVPIHKLNSYPIVQELKKKGYK